MVANIKRSKSAKVVHSYENELTKKFGLMKGVLLVLENKGMVG